MKNTNRFALIFLLSVLGTACTGGSKDKTLPIVAVEKRDLVQRVTMQGTIESRSQQVVIAPYDGNIKKIFVKTGESVKANAPLVAVESTNSLGTAFPLRASFDGIVTYIGVRAGEYVRGKNEDKILVRVDDLSEMLVRAKISESDYPKLKLDQEAVVAVQALPQLQLAGRVSEVSMAPSEAKRWRGNESIQYEVVVRLQEFPKDLKPGMSVIVDVTTAKKDQADSLPHEYVKRKDRKLFVELDPDHELKEVQVGLQNDEFLEVIGLPTGTKVYPVDFYSEKKD